MLTASVPLWLTVVIVIIAIGVTFAVAHRWRKENPDSYGRAASGAKRAGDRIEAGVDRIGDKVRGRDDGNHGDG